MPNPRLLLLAALAPLPLFPVTAQARTAERVVFKPLPGFARSAAISRLQATPISGLDSLSLPVNGDPVRIAARLARTPGIGWAEPAVQMHTEAADPLKASQWALGAIHVDRGWALAGIGSLPALNGVPVGIVDTGVDSAHEELKGRIRACAASASGRIREGICDDRDGHGTHVAGIAAASTGNPFGIAGVAAASPIIACRALGPAGSGSSIDVAACIAWVAKAGAKVISLSLGGPNSKIIEQAVSQAWAGGTAAGAVIVAAAGNEGPGQISWPAGLSQVVSVAACGRDGHRAPFSDTNRDVEVTAPGVNILSLKAGGGYVAMSGTSMAAPHVAGAAALLWSSRPGLTAAAVRRLLDRSVRDAGPVGRDPLYGLGLLDFASAG